MAPFIYDEKFKGLREPISKDLTEHIKVLNHCQHIDFQSGSFVLNDVPKAIASSYRYYLSLLYSPKPMFGGAFGIEDLKVIREMLVVMAGGEKELKDKPIAVIATTRNIAHTILLTCVISFFISIVVLVSIFYLFKKRKKTDIKKSS